MKIIKIESCIGRVRQCPFLYTFNDFKSWHISCTIQHGVETVKHVKNADEHKEQAEELFKSCPLEDMPEGTR